MRLLTWCVCVFGVTGIMHAGGTGTPQLTGAIHGVVVNDEPAPRPVRRAVVTAVAVGTSASQSTVTDDEGRFTLEGVPVGSYAIVASRPTFVTSAYGAQRPARRGRLVSVMAGQVVPDLVVRLWRGAVLSGTIRDAQGRAVPGQRVRAIPAVSPAAAFLTLTNNPAVSDDHGEFRIFGLEPGEYYLSTQPQASPRSATLLQDAYVDQILEALRRTGRGVLAQTGRLNSGAQPALTLIDSPVYWPGTVHASHAGAIPVDSGTERSGLDLHLIPTPTVVVTGRVLRTDGAAAGGATVRVSNARELSHLAALATTFSTVAGQNGAFLIEGVPAGSYQISASMPATAATVGAHSRTLWAVDRLDASGTDVHGVLLQLQPGLTVSGRVQIASAAERARVPPGASVALMPASTGHVSPTVSLESAMGGAAIMADGTFVIPDLRPEIAYRLFVNGMGRDVWPVSAIIAGVDLFDGPTVLGAEHSSQPLTVTFAPQSTSLFGTLSGDDMISPIFVVVFPTNRTQWGQERRTRAMQPDANGRYQFDNLPPGEYWIGAIGDVDPDAWRSVAFLEALERQALKVMLGDGEHRQVDLRTR